MKNTADVIVIGGGIMGTATAYHLAKRGYKPVLFEKTQLGAGSTGLTGGIIRQHYSIETTARMALRALKTWSNFDQMVGGDVGFIKTGALFLAGPEKVEGMRATVAMMKSVGIEVELVDPDAVDHLAPYLERSDVAIAAYEPDSGVADGSLACSAFATRSRHLGAQIFQGVEVIAIRLDKDRVSGIDTTDGPWEAPVVVNTAGPWGPKLAAQAGVKVPAEPSRHQIASFHQPKDFQAPMHMIVADLVNAHYMRSEVGGLTLAGSIENDTSDKVPNPDSFNQWTDTPFVETMMERCLKRVPDLARGGLARGWAGLYTVTPDWNPIIDRAEALPGLVLGLGFSGSGFKLGPVVGEMLADLATDERQCPIDPAIFSLGRFAEGIDLSSDYGYNILG